MSPSGHHLSRSEGFHEIDWGNHRRKNGRNLGHSKLRRKSNVFQHLNPQPTQSAQPGMAEALSQQGSCSWRSLRLWFWICTTLAFRLRRWSFRMTAGTLGTMHTTRWHLMEDTRRLGLFFRTQWLSLSFRFSFRR